MQTISERPKYKSLRNKVNNLKKFAKRNFFSNLENKIEDNRLNNSKDYWKTIEDLMKNYESLESIPVLKTNEVDAEEFFFTGEEKANCLNGFFTSVSKLDDSSTTLPLFVKKGMRLLTLF